jgi:hypothetical protein
MFNPEEVGANSARFAPGIMNPAVWKIYIVRMGSCARVAGY